MSRPSLSVEVVRSDSELHALESQWSVLFERSSTRNPFVHPAWMTAWLRHFVPDEQRRLVLVARRGGELVAVGPFYRRVRGRGRTAITALQLAGSSPTSEDPLTEMAEVLALPEVRHTIMREFVRALTLEYSDGCDWIGLTVPAEYGWFNDEWVPRELLHRGAFVAHKAVRPFVTLPLPRAWEELRLKRNLREAIRRSKNRQAALDDPPEIEFMEGTDVRDGIAIVQRLHRHRAVVGDHLAHDDYFRNAAFAQFAADACAGLAATGNASVALCRVRGEPVAGRVVMRSGGSRFLSFSGLDPAYWRMGAATSLIVATIQRGIAAGDDLLNLSVNPDPAKLRWSDRIDFHNEFVIAAPSRRSRSALALIWQIRSTQVLAGRRRVTRQRLESG